jgi:hypothetical protein
MQFHVHAPSLGTNVLVFDAKPLVVALQDPLLHDVLHVPILDATAHARELAPCSGLYIRSLQRSRDLLVVLVPAAHSPSGETPVFLSDGGESPPRNTRLVLVNDAMFEFQRVALAPVIAVSTSKSFAGHVADAFS